MGSNTNNLPIKAGFIFIPMDREYDHLPDSYKADRCGDWGTFAKLNGDSINGWKAITFQEYQDAPL